MKINREYPKTLFVPYDSKIADITHADVNKHTLNLQTALSETREIVAIICGNTRVSGTGTFKYYPNAGSASNSNGSAYHTQEMTFVVIEEGTNLLEYALSVANDDWDLYCFGYVVKI